MIRYVFTDKPVIINSFDAADPQKIGECLQQIAEANEGHLKPEAVVTAAKNRRHPLHKHFEWDDQKAAQAYRLGQARHIIRAIAIEDPEDMEDKPAFVSVSDKGGRSYRSLGEIQSSARLQKLVLESAREDLKNFKRRYRRFEDLFEPHVSEAIARLEEDEDRPSA